MSTTTIILTRKRIPFLKRAIRSLQKQSGIMLKLVVVIDDCQQTKTFLESFDISIGSILSVNWIHMNRNGIDFSGPRRVALLRELGLSFVDTEWCSFLDDDNELEVNHLSSLLTCANRQNSMIAHSWRTLWTRDGNPFLIEDRHPWARTDQLSRQLFLQYKAAGIYTSGTNVIKDQVVPNKRDYSMVDMSEWLFKTDIIREIGFETNYIPNDWYTSNCEDSKLLTKIVSEGIEVPSTRNPSLRYYLGGYSNSLNEEAAQIVNWR